ncbi:hypothetical protein L5515_007718 [Caenorhabditis briggsae]|uniref:7TM GPCR serpentine receptor class x (Srx) domain-containing protein n=1 Tax=Caenorhabditis briggsae TaxID=6238 RepID=A0AAE9JML4_CAEBR|nr:hypothetical protein L5515_007718 [Caenorhabditis briggsae]
MSSSTLSDPLNWIATILMALNGIFGITCNGLIVYSFTASSSERTSFNLICAYRAIVNIIILGWGFLGTFVPLTLFLTTPWGRRLHRQQREEHIQYKFNRSILRLCSIIAGQWRMGGTMANGWYNGRMDGTMDEWVVQLPNEWYNRRMSGTIGE